MRLLKKVRKKKPKLYELYKIESSKKIIEIPTVIEGDKDTVDNGVVPRKVKEEGERRKAKNAKRKENILPDKMTITISSLEGRIGCSHMALTIATYVSSKNKRACIVDYKKDNSIIAEINGISIFPKNKLDDLYDEYDYIILDISNKIEERSIFSEIKRSRMKIIMATIDDTYINKLGNFINNYEDAGSYRCIYIFNNTPKEKHKNVDTLMEDFEHYCLPERFFDPEKLNEEILEVLEILFKNLQRKEG